MHPFDRGRLRFRSYGREHTLPTFWTVCDGCELLVRSGDDDALVVRMTQSYGGGDDAPAQSPGQVAEQVRQPLEAFRRADLGARPFPTER